MAIGLEITRLIESNALNNEDAERSVDIPRSTTRSVPLCLPESNSFGDSCRDADISNIGEILDATQELRIRRLDQTNNEASPFETFPPEVLARIFLETLDPQGVVVPSPHRSAIPWSLGQVCSTWRAVIRAEPLLWTRILIRKVHTGCKSPSLIMKDVLDGCGGQGRVDIRFSPSGSEDWMNLLDLLAAYPTRLRGLGIVLDDTLFEALLKPLAAFGNLETLSLYYGHVRRPPVPNVLSFYGFSAAKSLRSVTIQFGLYPDATDICGKVLPWDHLTDLSLLGASATSALIILNHCVSLVTLKLDIRRLGQDTFPLLQAVSLTYLRSLSITANDIRNPNRLLSSLYVPCLTTLTIQDCSLQEGWLDKSGLALLFEHSGCQITSFRTQGLSFPVRDILVVMRAMPLLQELSVIMAEPISDSVLSIIMDEALVPNLYKLEGWEFSSIHSAIRLLNNRWKRSAFGHYTGIKNARFWLRSHAYPPADQSYFSSLSSELKEYGRFVQVNIDEY